MYFPGGSDDKESSCNVGDLGLIPGLGRSPGEGSGNPLQYFCLENPMDGGAQRVTESQTRLSDKHNTALHRKHGLSRFLTQKHFSPVPQIIHLYTF